MDVFDNINTFKEEDDVQLFDSLLDDVRVAGFNILADGR